MQIPRAVFQAIALVTLLAVHIVWIGAWIHWELGLLAGAVTWIGFMIFWIIAILPLRRRSAMPGMLEEFKDLGATSPSDFAEKALQQAALRQADIKGDAGTPQRKRFNRMVGGGVLVTGVLMVVAVGAIALSTGDLYYVVGLVGLVCIPVGVVMMIFGVAPDR